MTQDDFNFADDLEQIVRRRMSSLIALEELKTAAPDHAADFSAMQEKSQEILDGIKEMAEQARKNFEENELK